MTHRKEVKQQKSKERLCLAIPDIEKNSCSVGIHTCRSRRLTRKNQEARAKPWQLLSSAPNTFQTLQGPSYLVTIKFNARKTDFFLEYCSVFFFLSSSIGNGVRLRVGVAVVDPGWCCWGTRRPW